MKSRNVCYDGGVVIVAFGGSPVAVVAVKAVPSRCAWCYCSADRRKASSDEQLLCWCDWRFSGV